MQVDRQCRDRVSAMELMFMEAVRRLTMGEDLDFCPLEAVTNSRGYDK